MRTFSSARLRLGVASRLLGLVLIPSVGLGALGLQAVRDQADLAGGASEVAAEVDDVVAALDAFMALTDEFRQSEILVQAAAFGVSPETLADWLGYDVEAAMGDARAAVDANPLVATLEAQIDDVGGLDAARQRFARERTERTVSAELFAEARRTFTQELRELFGRGSAVLPAPEVTRALEGLRAAVDLSLVNDERIVIASSVMVPGSLEDLAAGSDLDAVQARYTERARDVVELVDRHLVATARGVVEDDGFDAAVATVLDGDLSNADLAEVTAVLRVGIESAARHQDLVVAAADEAGAHARKVGEAAQHGYDRTLAAVVAMLLLTFTAAAVVARSIARPLRRLAGQAAAVSAGDLDGDEAPEEGPREVAVLARMLNDTVANLRAVARGMGALAAGDLDGARLAETPGRLGDLVGRSVDGLARSIAERDNLQRRLAHDAAHDALTGLANRRTTMHRLDALLDAGEQVGLLYLDLDGFKQVNDEFGHAVGDRLLVVTARRIAKVVDDDALVARLGGDEFVVGTVARSREAVLELAEDLVRVLAEPFSIDGLPHRVGASIGVALAMPDDDADRLLRSADHALYAAKRDGRGGVAVLDAELRAQVDETHRIETDLRAAIVADDLELHYQPLFRADGALHGVEALVRWLRPDGTLVAPDEFVPVAERSGLVVDLDRWVLRHALAQLREWRAASMDDMRLSVNVSARTLLSSTFVDDVRAALHEAGVPGDTLTVEVTETALLHDLATAAHRITALLELGVRTSVDDFGTGYTSVSHLRSLPVREVKIDRSFVQAMATDERDRVLVDLVARMGTVLGLDVVAEGVETQEQLDALQRLGCRFAQGFLLGRPVPAGEVAGVHAAAAGSDGPLRQEGTPLAHH